MGRSERLVLFALIHADFKTLNDTSNFHLKQTVPRPCVWSNGPGVRGHCQTAVCLHFPILLRPQAGVVRRRMYSRATALSAKKYFWKMLDGKSSSTVKRVSSAASAVEYSFHLGFIMIFLIHFPKGCKIQSPLLIAVRSANKRKTRAKLSLQQWI